MKNLLLIRFQQNTVRVKSVSFHPQRPWLLVSLHDGSIQLWDYRSEVLIDKFDEHAGPVRGVHFHPTQPLFVSGGDDSLVKVWNYQQRRCLFNLSGHLDYVRSVQFHHHYPWVLSASDDQTIRIWNWQSRSSVAVLTGHNYYVMCARFHPSQDLIVSASLDCTIRVWDFSGLTRKTVSIGGSVPLPMSPNNPLGGGELFGVDVEVRHVLEGHTKGVNWASFHPTLPLIVSGGDDHDVRVWRLNESRAWPVDTLRGHTKNVSCVIFHPKLDAIVSNAEDKSLRVWDVSKNTVPTVVCRESDRFWTLDAHPTSGLLAAGHDGGFMVFKLHRERPAYATLPSSPTSLFIAKDNAITLMDTATNASVPVCQLPRPTNVPSALPRTLYVNPYSPSQFAAIVMWTDGRYDLLVAAKPNGFPNTPSQIPEASFSRFHGNARNAVFVSSTRFAILDKSKAIQLRSLKDELKRKISIPGAAAIFPGGNNRILVRCAESMLLYDVQACRPVAEMRVSPRHLVKYVTWSADGKHVAIQSKSTLYLATAQLSLLAQVTETQRVKAVAWDACGACIYSTHTHLKYALPTGESGPLRTLDTPLYPFAVCATSVPVTTPSGAAKGVFASELLCLDRDRRIVRHRVNPAEYQFRLALSQQRAGVVARLLASGALVGDALVEYAVQRGYPELALHFTDDPKRRFALALRAGALSVAQECAVALDDGACWAQLAAEATAQGAVDIAEACHVRARRLAELSMLYTLTGDVHKKSQLRAIAEAKGDAAALAHAAVSQHDVSTVAGMLAKAGHMAFARAAAAINGCVDALPEPVEEEEAVPAPYLVPLAVLDGTASSGAARTVAASQLLQATPAMPAHPTLLAPLAPLEVPSAPGHYSQPWPLLPVTRGFDFTAKEEVEEPVDAIEAVASTGTVAGDEEDEMLAWGAEATSAVPAAASPAAAEEAFEGEGWDLGDIDLGPEEAAADATGAGTGTFALPERGTDYADAWCASAAAPGAAATSVGAIAVHVAAGRLDHALHLLQSLLGVCTFAPFRPHFIRAALLAKAAVPSLPGLPLLPLPLHAAGVSYTAGARADSPPVLHAAPSLRLSATLLQQLLREALVLAMRGQATPAQAAFHSLLTQLPLCDLSTAEARAAVAQGRVQCREHLLYYRLEKSRAGVTGNEPSDAARKAELAAYACACALEPTHLVSQLWVACKYMFQVKNYATVAALCRRIIDAYPRADSAALAGKLDIEVVRRMLRKCDAEARDHTAVRYPAPHGVCAVSLTPLPNPAAAAAAASATAFVECVFCGSAALGQYSGCVCPVCEVGALGARAPGWGV